MFSVIVTPLQQKMSRIAEQSEEKQGKSHSVWQDTFTHNNAALILQLILPPFPMATYRLLLAIFRGSSLPSSLLFSHSPDLPLVSWHYISAKAVWQRC